MFGTAAEVFASASGACACVNGTRTRLGRGVPEALQGADVEADDDTDRDQTDEVLAVLEPALEMILRVASRNSVYDADNAEENEP